MLTQCTSEDFKEDRNNADVGVPQLMQIVPRPLSQLRSLPRTACPPRKSGDV